MGAESEIEPIQAIANTANTETAESANNANTDEAIIEAIANNANTGELVKSAGLRIEINRKRLSNGGYLYFGAYRERNKGRKFAGYIKWSQIPEERKAGYHPRDEAEDATASGV